MSDMIETVARAVALAANDYEGPDLQWHGWTDIAQAAITAHTAALIAGAGELCERLTKQMCNHRSEDLCGCPLCAALSEAAATIAALRAELAQVREQWAQTIMQQDEEWQGMKAQLATARLEGVRLGIEASARALEDDARLCDCFARSEVECACGAWSDYKTVPMERAVDVVRTLDPAAIVKGIITTDTPTACRTTALSELIAADAHLIDGEPQ